MDDEMTVGIGCGLCGGGIYMETCGVDGCTWAVAGECQRCGERTPHTCPDHGTYGARDPSAPPSITNGDE